MRPLLFFRLLFLSMVLFSFTPRARAAEPVSFTLDDVVKRMELRRGTWIGLKADVQIRFITADEQSAACKGVLLYHRLDESLRLDCFNEDQKLVFIFKAQDRDFELYLPSRKSLYQGNIFSLEDSPAIESHLKAWDLYRALKPLLVFSENTTLTAAPEGLVSIEVKRSDESLSRSLSVSNQGDIISETYYSLDGNPTVLIKRGDFQKIIPAPASETESAFPHKISIENKKEDGAAGPITEFYFEKLDFSAEIPDSSFTLQLTDDIRTIALEDHAEAS